MLPRFAAPSRIFAVIFDARMRSLPGSELIAAGLDDYEAGRATAAALLVAMAASRLQRAGLLDRPSDGWPEPEFALYALLQQQPGDAYARYNALRRELDSFLAALSRERHSRARPAIS